ncbi:unnamed protein product [Symbiodinium natans]|uniref:IPT/TIG domain-containing protein n=1 Tax=Symbiodinium natans TaxID=878477 RepID=A0A812MF05_9DINO|nr:unnamed protein product [Symbiodinium natans]
MSIINIICKARPLGGFLLATVWSPNLLDAQPDALGSEAFPVRLLPRLGISSVSPDFGPVTGGTLIAVVGNGFSQQGRLPRPQLLRSCAFAAPREDDNLYMPARFFNESLIYCDPGSLQVIAKLLMSSLDDICLCCRFLPTCDLQ